MNDSRFWQQGQPAFPTHWKAITSQAHRNDHGCWSFVDSVIVTQKWGNLSLRVPNTPVVSELKAVSCKSNDWEQMLTNPHCYGDSTGELRTPQAASLWKPRLLFILKQKMSVDQYGFRLRKTGSDFVVEATLKSWTETPKPTPQLLPDCTG